MTIGEIISELLTDVINAFQILMLYQYRFQLGMSLVRLLLFKVLRKLTVITVKDLKFIRNLFSSQLKLELKKVILLLDNEVDTFGTPNLVGSRCISILTFV